MTQESKALRGWLRAHAQVREADKLSTVHLDELGFDRKDLRSVERLMSIYLEGLREVASLVNLKFIMVLPLKPSRRLIRPSDRNIDALMSKLSDIEPPPIYLLRPHQFLGREVLEEYRFPIPVSAMPPGYSYVVYLRQFRRAEYIEKGWEYENGIYLEQVCWIEDPGGTGPIAV